MSLKRIQEAGIEILDQAGLDADELRRSLLDVARLNRWFGGTRAVADLILRLAAARTLSGIISVLDVGCGGGDILRALTRWGARSGLRVCGVGCDRNAQVLAVAAGLSDSRYGIRLVNADGVRPPFRAGSFDFVTCSLLLHHLNPDEVTALLSSLRTVARHALIVNDLERSRAAWAGVWLATRVVCRSPWTRHDGPLSVRRAYTLEELRVLSERAGCARMRWWRGPLFRISGVLEV
ncbi:MAG: methyltransferase domain-containing protein [Bryobacteraceae bacterium]|nr:methyltransferase domain-containing protein [Bryobacteraceae bacterium]